MNQFFRSAEVRKYKYSESNSTINFMYYENDLIFRKATSNETIHLHKLKTTLPKMQKYLKIKEVII